MKLIELKVGSSLFLVFFPAGSGPSVQRSAVQGHLQQRWRKVVLTIVVKAHAYHVNSD